VDNCPTYSTEVRFYRLLGIGYRLGSQLYKCGVITPDAKLDDGRPIFANTAQAMERHRAELRAYRARQRAARANVKNLAYA